MKKDTSQLAFLDRIPSFSLLLIMAVGMVIGMALIPLLKVAYEPTPKQGKTLSVSVSWPGASAQVVEQEITSKIEGVVSSVVGVERTSSTSSLGSGSVQVELKENVNVLAVRFEISSLLRQMASQLPEGAGYPVLADNKEGGEKKRESRLVLSYNIHADMDPTHIQYYVERNISPYLNQIDYVREVNVSGATPLYLDIEYHPVKLQHYGLDAAAIRNGVTRFLGQRSIVGDVERMNRTGERERMTLLLETQPMGTDIGRIPLTAVGGRIIYLGEVATFHYKEQPLANFYRINGMNTVNLSIHVDADVNIITASAALRERMEWIQQQLDEGCYVELTNDEAEKVREELKKLVSRTFLSLLFLFLFVWISSRSGRYLSVIAVSLIANVLLAVIFFYLFGIELNIISLAGMAVSFGIMIDTTIVMVDHYSYYRNRNVFLAILAALLTTVGSLIIVFFMPEYVKSTLNDFAAIIIVNLVVALLVALLFVPALIERIQLQRHQLTKSRKYYRRVAGWTAFYTRYISFTQKHKWVYVLLLIWAFGLPVQWLPERVGYSWYEYLVKGRPEQAWYVELYNSTIGGEWYQHQLRPSLEKWLGGTLRLFAKNQSPRMFANEKQELQLYISAHLTEGEDTGLLNQKMGQMDRFLAQFSEIKRFVTRGSGSQGSIVVEFADEFAESDFPFVLENQVIREALTIGGVDWNTSGVSQRGFSNSLSTGGPSYSIGLSGYNYDFLYKCAEKLAADLQQHKRVKDVSFEESRLRDYGYRGEEKDKEMYIRYDKEKVVLYDLNLKQGYEALSALLAENQLGTYEDGEKKMEIKSHSCERDRFDVWHLLHSYVPLGEKPICYAQIGEIGTRAVNKQITKSNQEYSLDVAFNYEGTTEMADEFIRETTEKVNASLPVGFRTTNRSRGWYDDTGSQYGLLFLIAVIIFFTCAVLFESLRQPLVIISLIPISFIGTFLTFYFTGVNFGTGGFASLVLLSGLVVNAGIYIINEYNDICRTSVMNKQQLPLVKLYVKAYNHKIIAVLLTVLSTVLGLIPFLMDGPKAEAFWFSFAVGIMGGLLFSVLALTFFLPILMTFSPKKKVVVQDTETDSCTVQTGQVS